MRTGENMVTLEKLRLREVALNSLLAKMGKDLRVKATEVRKNNVQKPAFGIGIAGASLQIRCYPTPEDMAMSDLELLNELAKKFQEATSGVAVVDMLPSREELIAHLMPRVMGSANAGWLREAGRPCKELLDMVMTLQCGVDIDGISEYGEVANIQVTDSLLRQCGLAVDEAFAIAMKNIESVAQISPIRTVLEELLGEELPDGDNEPKMIIVSNEQRCNGASLMFSKKIQSELLEIFGKKAVYVLPSSIHEFIAVSASYMPIDDMREMVRTINANEVDPEDRLTDEVYTLIGTPENPVFGMSSGLGGQGQETFLTARF